MDELVASIDRMASTRGRRVAAVTLRVPAGEDVESLRSELARRGHHHVELRTQPGPLRLLSVEFDT